MYSLLQVDLFKSESVRTQLVTEFPNSYVGACIKTVPFMHEDYAKLTVLATLLTNKFIHKEVRSVKVTLNIFFARYVKFPNIG